MRLAEVTEENFEAAVAIDVRADQQDLVAPVVKSLAEAWLHYESAWPRVIYDGDELVGFVMAFVEVEWPGSDDIRSGLWRLNIAGAKQGLGYGRFAVKAVCEELRSRGAKQAYVTFERRAGGPQRFYEKLGFRLTGEIVEGEAVAVLEMRGTEMGESEKGESEMGVRLGDS
jgi:diamine N-acetyltransferase